MPRARDPKWRQPHPTSLGGRRDVLRMGTGVLNTQAPLGVATHWTSGADCHRTPGWRPCAESRPQERRSPVWHSPGQRGQNVRPSHSLGEPRATLGCLRQGHLQMAYPDPSSPNCKAGRLHHHLLHPVVSAPTAPCRLPPHTPHPQTKHPSSGAGNCGRGHLQDPVAKAEAGGDRRAVEPQLIVHGGARRVQVSASEGAQHCAHRCSLGDLSPGSRAQEVGRESGLDRERWLEETRWPR